MLRIIKGLMFVIILLSIYLVGRILISNINDFYYLHIYDNSAQISEYYEEEKTRLYNECLMASYNESDDTEYLEAAEDNLTSFLDDYNASISFKDVNTGYAYEYNSDRQYYAASTIKMLDAIYIYICL